MYYTQTRQGGSLGEHGQTRVRRENTDKTRFTGKTDKTKFTGEQTRHGSPGERH